MASTVYVKSIAAFDAANAKVITFGYSGTQCTKNRIIVYNSSTNAVVYDDTVTTFALTHTIPEGTLTNGTSYYCTITAYYTESSVEYSVTSASSNVFKCLTTATFGFNGLTEGTVIGNSYYAFTLTYSQTESETVNEYYIVLYTTSGTVYWTSGALHDIAATTTVTGLPNDTVLYARAYGTTTNGLTLDTRNASTGADISVTVDYTSPALYSLAYLENNKWKGWVKVSTNVASVEGTSASTITYINDEYADLSSDGVSVLFENILITGTPTIEALAYSITINKPFMTIAGTNLEIVVTFRQATFSDGEKFFAELKETNSGYVLYSNQIAVPTSTDLIHTFIQRNSGLFSLVVANMGVAS